MSANVGYATVSIIPSAKGFAPKLDEQLNRPLSGSGQRGGKTYGAGMMGGLAATVGKAGVIGAAIGSALGIGKIASDAIALEKDFSQTMNTMAAVANVPKPEIKGLSDLAMKMGADTVFSASEAAGAMLELAKGGLSAATIQGGALQGTLTLAAAGGTDLGTAATIASNALNTFGLKGKDMASVAAALAGGANASSASVESLGEALGQVGPGATNAGLSLQETVASLSAFDAAGIKGSDAGTSLKTMLASLTPNSEAAASAMKQLGLDFTDAKGNFVPITNVAEQLRQKLGGLSEAQRQTALETIFGSDASRAATVMTKLGAKGLEGYIKATNDAGAANRVASARMSGTAGAIEAMKGSAETAKLALGQALAPATVAGANLLAQGFNRATVGIKAAVPAVKSFFAGLSAGGSGGGLMSSLSATGESLKAFGAAILPPLREVGTAIMATLGPGIRSVSTTLQTTFLPAFRAILPILAPIAAFIIRTLGSAVVGVLRGVFAVINGVLKIIGGLFTVIASAVRGDWSGMWEGVKTIASGVMQTIKGAIQIFWNVGILGAFKKIGVSVIGSFKGTWTSLKNAASAGMETVKSWISKGLAATLGYFKALPGKAVSAIGSVTTKLKSKGTDLISGLVSGVTGKVKSFTDLIKSLPGKALDALGSLGSKLSSAGGDLIAGFVSGIRNAAGSIVSAIRDSITDKIPQFVRDKLGIRSPSRVFMEIGGYTAEGMALGISKNAGLVTKAADGLAYAPSATAAGQSAATATATARENVFHLYDADGHLMGTMRGAARTEITQAARGITRGTR